MTYQPPEPVSPPPVATPAGGYPVPPQPSGSQPSGPPSTPHIPPDDLDAEDSDAYADPRRNWKRSGALLGGWAAACIAVFAVGATWQVVAEPGERDIEAEDPGTQYSLTNEYMDWIFVDKNFERATSAQCEGYSGPTAQELADDMSEWKYSDGTLPDASVGVPDELGGNKFQIVITVDAGASGPQPMGYRITIDPSADPLCVAGVERLEE